MAQHRRIGLLILLLLGAVGCDDLRRAAQDLHDQRPPQQRYVDALKNARLATSALGLDWITAGDRALREVRNRPLALRGDRAGEHAGSRHHVHDFLPLRPLEVETTAPTSTRVENGTGRILLADDEELVRHVARRMLERLGYDVDVATDGEEAIARVVADPTRYDLVIFDGNMPRVPGRETALRIRDAVPGMRMLLATGYIEPRDAERLPSLASAR